ncbi:MAG: RpiB/LacA/LacB family sugar-phosphate isomerase [Anaerolineae bacterium]|nr:RpiB/LacA/LacB family sugar-phosphate isomerase [Anaerolineae bacterium]
MRIAVGSDERTHLTDTVVEELQKRGLQVTLFGPLAGNKDAWPEVARAVAEQVSEGHCDEGVVLCWTGTGVSMAANKVPGIRAALCHDAETAKGARLWNHANILAMSLRATSEAVAKEILAAWFATPPWGPTEEDRACVARLGEIEQFYLNRSLSPTTAQS